MNTYFAHNGIDHGAEIEAAVHTINPIIAILGVTAVIAVLLIITMRLLGRPVAEKTTDKVKKS